MNRAAQVIEAADERGQIVILTYFYQREDEFLNGADAVRAATVNATDWLIERGYRNVIIEIANEYNALLYDHEILKANRTTNGVAELILLAKSRFAGLDYRLPVSVSSRDLLLPGRAARGVGPGARARQPGRAPQGRRRRSPSW